MAETVLILVLGVFIGGLIVWLIARSRPSDTASGLRDTILALSAEALERNNQQFLTLAQQQFKTILEESKGDIGKRQEAIDGLIKPLKETISRYENLSRELESSRQKDYGGLRKQVEQLHAETAALVDALKNPQARGRWGEITLRRVVELAGLSPYCDFTEQESIETEKGRVRPDLIVRLPSEGKVVVDSKVPLNAYNDAMAADNEEARKTALSRHAQAVKEHVRMLSSKKYWEEVQLSPDFVVLFLPGEAIFRVALEQDGSLIEEGFSSRVIITTPTTLYSLLKTVALTWQQHQAVENSRKILDAGSELFDRFLRFSEYLGKIRDGLEKASRAYNEAVGSWEKRVVPGARKLKELGASRPGKELPDAEPVETSLREPPKEAGDD